MVDTTAHPAAIPKVSAPGGGLLGVEVRGHEDGGHGEIGDLADAEKAVVELHAP